MRMHGQNVGNREALLNEIVPSLRELYGDDLLAVIFYEIGELPPKRLGLLVIVKKLKTATSFEEYVVIRQFLKARIPWLPVDEMFISAMTEEQLKQYKKSSAWKEIKRGKIAVWDPHRRLKGIV